MTKIKFTNNEGNLTSKGFVLGVVYEIGPRTESQKNPGKFYHSVSGEKVTPYNEWETTLFKYFMFQKDTEESKRAKEYLASLNPVNVAPAPVVQTAPIAQVSVPIQQIPQLIQPVVQRIPYGSDFDKDAVPAKEVVTEGRDILLAGLTKLDFQSLNLKLLKIEGKIELSVVYNTAPVLKIVSGDISAASVLEQIVSTFSENAQIVATIDAWRKELKETEANLERDVAVVKTRTKKTAKAQPAEELIPDVPVAIEPVVEEISVEPAVVEPVVGTIEPSVADTSSYMNDELDMPQPESAEEEEPDSGNGLDTDVEDFELK